MKPDWAERIQRGRRKAKQEGLDRGIEIGVTVGAWLEQERIVNILDRNLGKVDWEDLVILIKGEDK